MQARGTLPFGLPIDILKSSFNRNMGREHEVLGSEVCMGSKLLGIAIKTSGCLPGRIDENFSKSSDP